jgi:hypothetical protein
MSINQSWGKVQPSRCRPPVHATLDVDGKTLDLLPERSNVRAQQRRLTDSNPCPVQCSNKSGRVMTYEMFCEAVLAIAQRKYSELSPLTAFRKLIVGTLSLVDASESDTLTAADHNAP